MADAFRREYSKRLGTLSGDQLQSALSRFGLGDLIDARPAHGGLFGQNVFLTTSSGGYVLRGAPYQEWQFEKERFFCRAVHERSHARAPWPFLIEDSPELFGWKYAVMPLLPGVHLSDPEVQRSLSPADKVAIARAMGAYLALIHEATWDAPGEYAPDRGDLAPLATTFAGWFVARTRDWLAWCRRASEYTTVDDVAWVESVVNSARDALEVPFAPTLVHTDYAEGNVVAQRNGGAWSIGGVFDLGEAYAGDGEYDLARLACAYSGIGADALSAFLGAYTAARPPRPRFAERFALYLMHDRLVIWEYGQRNKVWFTPGVAFRSWAESYVEIAGRVSEI